MYAAAVEYLLEKISMSLPDWAQPHFNNTVTWIHSTFQNLDLDYMEYLFWLFLPIFIAFVLPVLLLFFIYGCAIFLHIYGWRHRILEAYASSYWDGARTSIASFWDAVGWIWHGYEVRGLEHIPDEGPVLFVAYHGTLPLDIYYLIARVLLQKKRQLHVVGDKFVFRIPGWNRICQVFCVTPGTVEDCVACLKEGNLQIVAPGGVREALFSNPRTYKIMWASRLGFAKPVIPVFTENCRDAFRTPRWGRRLCRAFYEHTRLPICPIYGGFPVKMITHLGKSLTFDDTYSVEDIKMVVKERVEDLIQTHQKLPGSVFRSICQRFNFTKCTEEQNDDVHPEQEVIQQRISRKHGEKDADNEGRVPLIGRERSTSASARVPTSADEDEETEDKFTVQEKEDADLSEFS